MRLELAAFGKASPSRKRWFDFLYYTTNAVFCHLLFYGKTGFSEKFTISLAKTLQMRYNMGNNDIQVGDLMKKDLLYRLFFHIPTLKTDRLTLRGMCVSDAPDMYEYACRPSVTEYLTWEPHASVEETRAYLTYVGQRYRTGDFYDWALISRDDGRMIGTCGFTSFNCPADSAEIGYVLNPAYQGQGLATEAVRRVMRFGFEELSLHRVEAHFMEGNHASRRLMERVGMTFEGFAREAMKIKGKYRTVGTCAILKNEFWECKGEPLLSE